MKPLDPLEKAHTRTVISIMKEKKLTFFTSVLLALKTQFTTDVETAATNGRDLLINPDFYMGLSPAEREFLLMHEIYHVVFKHMVRLGDRELAKWNVATDYVINAELVNLGMKMPKSGLYDKQYEGLSADEVYSRLPDNVKPPMQDLQCPAPGQKDSQGDPANSQQGNTSVESLEAHLDNIIKRAAMQAEMAKQGGSIPADVQRYLEKLHNPKLPWNQILRRFLFAKKKTERSFRKPNRRYMPMIMPSRFGEAAGHFTVVIDVSGSVSQAQFTQFISEVHKILTDMRPSKLTVIQFSYGITAIDEVKTLRDLVNVKFQGGGGTAIQEVCDWVAAHKPEIVLCFTDGYFREPERTDKSPWVWLINDNPNMEMSWGKTIHFDTE